MSNVIAYMCHTQTSAFSLVELIESQGGKAHKYVGEKRVLSDYPFTDEEVAKQAQLHIARPDEAAEIEIKLFAELEK